MRLAFRKIIFFCRLERDLKGNRSLARPLLQYSTQKLKIFFPAVHCNRLQTSMEEKLTNRLPNSDIGMKLAEVEQFYKELTIINQFCRKPFIMPSPCHCISQLTHLLAVWLKESENIWQDIAHLFEEDKILIGLTKEIYKFV